MATGPAQIIPAPALTPPPTGLIRTATVIDHPDDLHWGGGIEWSPEGCGDLAVLLPCVGATDASFTVAPAGEDTAAGGTFTISWNGATTTAIAYDAAAATIQAALEALTSIGAGNVSVGGGPGVNEGFTITFIGARGQRAQPPPTISSALVTGADEPYTYTVAAAATGGVGLKATANNRPSVIRYEPFAVEAHDSCSTFGFTAADYEGRARRAIAARESKAVEHEWWTGTLVPTNPHLAKASGSNGPNATSLAGGAAQGLRTSLAMLCQALADLNGGTGMVHARPFLVEMWFGLDLLYRDAGGKLWTGTGTPVVAGTGYPGTGPAGEAVTSTSEWAFASDAVEVHRGPVSIVSPFGAESVDRFNNEGVSRVERLYALAFNGCALAAVKVNPTVTTS